MVHSETKRSFSGLLWLSMLTLLPATAGCEAQSPRAPFGFDVCVAPPENQRIPGNLSLELNADKLADGFKLTPQVVLRPDIGQCPSGLTELRRPVPNEMMNWKARFEVNCSSLDLSGNQELPAGAGWRLRLVGDPLPESFELSSIRIKSAPTADAKSGSKCMQGKFTHETFDFRIPGFRVTATSWHLDEGSPQLATYMLVATVEREASNGEPKKGENTVETAAVEPSPPPKLAEVPKEMPLLKTLELEAVLDQAVPLKKWPPLDLWIKPEGEAWQGPIPLKAQDVQRPQLWTLPPSLAGRDFFLQIQSGGLTLPLDRDGTAFRQRVAGKGVAVLRLPVRLSPAVAHTLRVSTKDQDGNRLEGTMVLVQSYGGSGELLEERSGDIRSAESFEVTLFRRSAKVTLICAKQGYRLSVQDLSLSAGMAAVECRLFPEKPPPKLVEAPSIPLFYGGEVLGRRPGANGVELTPADAALSLTWSGGEVTRLKTLSGGRWGVPAPDPSSRLVRLEVEARCYRTFDRRLATGDLPDSPIHLDLSCRPTLLEVNLHAATPSISRKDLMAAGLEVLQDGRKLGSFANFDERGTKSVEVLVDPAGGPLEIHAAGNGFVGGPTTLVNPLSQPTSQFFTRVEVPLRQTGRGVAILVNAAENWPDYARTLQAIGETLAASPSWTNAPKRLLLGTLEGGRKLVDFSELRKPGGLKETVSWLRGISPTAVRLRFPQLEKRLSALADYWPAAGEWDLVLILPYDADNDDPEGVKPVGKLARDLLQRSKVTIHVVEVGGTSAVMKALADSGGAHFEVGKSDPTDQTLEELKAYLAGTILRSAAEGARR